jgi:hypothetical protein
MAATVISSKFALSTPQEVVWMEDCPTCIFSIISLKHSALVM